MKRSKRVLALLLICMLCLQLLPAATMAASSADCNHDWQAGRVISEATCTEPAQRMYTCRLCGATKRASYGRALGHRWDGGTITHYPKCTEYGEKKYTCTRCGATRISSYAEPLGHAWGDWSDRELRDGKYVRFHTCTRCGETEEDPDGMGGGAEEMLLLECTGGSGELTTLSETSYMRFSYRITNVSDLTVSIEGIHSVTDPNAGDVSTSDGTQITYGSSTTLVPHASLDGWIYIPVSENDYIIHTVSRNVAVYGYFDSDTAVSNTENFSGPIPDAPADTPEDSLYLETNLVTPNGFDTGDTIDVELTLTNTGAHEVEFHVWHCVDSYGKNPEGSSMDDPGISVLSPAHSVPIHFTLTVTPDDNSLGRVIRYINIGGSPVDDPTTDVTSNTVLIEVELGDPPLPEDSLYLEVDQIFQHGYQEGDTVDLYLDLTNMGYYTLTIKSWSCHDSDGVFNSGDLLTKHVYALSPDESDTAIIALTVTENDIKLGKVIRDVTFYGTRTFEEGPDIGSNTVHIELDLSNPPKPLNCLSLTNVHVSANGLKSGDVIDADLDLTNNGDMSVSHFTWACHDPDSIFNVGDTLSTPVYSLASSETAPLKLRLTVTPKDIQNGKLIRNVTFYGALTFDQDVKVVSNTVCISVDLGSIPEPEDSLLLECVSFDGVVNGTDPHVNYTVRVTNTGAHTVNVLPALYTVTDPNDNDRDVTAHASVTYNGSTLLAPGESVKGQLRIDVLDHDKVCVSMVRYLTVTGEKYDDKNSPTGLHLNSNPELFTRPMDGPVPDPAPGVCSLNVTITEISDPAPRAYYLVGEPIKYMITVQNTGTEILSNLNLFVDLRASNNGFVESKQSLNVNGICCFYFTYIPQPEDLGTGFVLNEAHITAIGPDGSPVKGDSGQIQSFIGGSHSPVDPKLDLCAVSLVVGEEGTLAYVVSRCTEHTAAAEQANEILAAAGDDPEARTEAFGKIAALWTDCVNGLYDQILAAAGTDAVQTIVTNDRDAFFAWLDAYTKFLTGLYPDDPAFVAEKRAELIAEKCAELCWLVHAAKNELPDSMLPQTVPQSEDGRCSLTLKTDTANLLVYAIDLCPEHAPAALQVNESMRVVLSGTADPDLLIPVRLTWEGILTETELRFSGPEAAEEQSAYDAYMQTEQVFTRLFTDSAVYVEEVLLKAALIRTLRLCPLSEVDAQMPQGGKAPTFTSLF